MKTLLGVWQIIGWAVALSVVTSPHPALYVPLLHNPSTAGTLLALLLLGSRCPITWGLFIAALWMIGASTPFFVLLVGLPFLWRRSARFFYWAYGVVALLGLPLMWQKLSTGGNGRFHIWALSLSWMWHRPQEWLLGSGWGTFVERTIMIQAMLNPANGKGTVLYPHAHNDWLELFLETGFVGLGVGLLIWASALYGARTNRRLQAMVAGYGAAMLTNFPLHHALLAPLGVVLVTWAYMEGYE